MWFHVHCRLCALRECRPGWQVNLSFKVVAMEVWSFRESGRAYSFGVETSVVSKRRIAILCTIEAVAFRGY